MPIWTIYLFVLLSYYSTDLPTGPKQPEQGPGSTTYAHQEITFQDFAQKQDGYWLFEPANPKPDTAAVIVFNHGYGAINPMIYGAWIKHLVRQGNIVIYPRYQRSLMVPSTKHFVDNATKGVLDALEKLKEESHIYPDTSSFFLAGHSYGGTIAANQASRYKRLGLPKPKGILLCAPGTGPFKGGLLESYEGMPSDALLLIVNSINDHVVGEKLGRFIFETATNTPKRNLIRLIPDDHGMPKITSGHNECYALDTDFDGGINNVSTKRAKHTAVTNATDYFVFWKLLDAMVDCSSEGVYCNVAIGNTNLQRNMGAWSDGQAITPVEVITPQALTSTD
jgi:predicted esterase